MASRDLQIHSFGLRFRRVLCIGVNGPYCLKLKNFDWTARLRGRREVLLLGEDISYHRGEGKGNKRHRGRGRGDRKRKGREKMNGKEKRDEKR